ncbi:MAG: hypothetical protein HFP81_07935 [Methylococcales symbiont of Hymedesmia sp. n. MRB-2018]|nr:MAG: hypothetical protein HFP78_08170 [Methylococcales symbiont of Hymedesmia sp. n. MRB-2018]KAF3983290.1 MAG: hypothetical protein HFP81_07935 [Methylococcales symbiont of Hymedesmia sp. n. MRB-2018]
MAFCKSPPVSSTHNRDELDLIMAKAKQKVSARSRSEVYAHAIVVSSCLQTMASKGINPLIAIQIALAEGSP